MYEHPGLSLVLGGRVNCRASISPGAWVSDGAWTGRWLWPALVSYLRMLDLSCIGPAEQLAQGLRASC